MIEQNRKFMNCPPFQGHMRKSDQQNGVPHPPHEHLRTGELIELPAFEEVLKTPHYLELLENRRSERAYSPEPLTAAQLAFMLWSTHSVKEFRGMNNFATLRPVPSGGARHPFELYVAVQNVEGLEPGIYHYLPIQNVGEKKVTIERVAPLNEDSQLQLTNMLVGQRWASKAPAILFVSCLPYRAEWRYGEAAHRVMLIDLGHIGQNIMLSATALGLGSCCMAAFDQQLCDETFGFDPENEYTVYAVSLGNLKAKK